MMLGPKNSVDKVTADTPVGKGAASSVFVALKVGLKVKVSPAMYGRVDMEPFTLGFEEGMCVPKNSMELFVLRQRQKLSKDVIELSKDVMVEAIAFIDKSAKKAPAEKKEEAKASGRKK